MAKRSPHHQRSQRPRPGATSTTGDWPGVRHATDARTTGPARPRPPAMGPASAAPTTLEPQAQRDLDHRRWARRPPRHRRTNHRPSATATTGDGPGVRRAADARSRREGPSTTYPPSLGQRPSTTPTTGAGPGIRQLHDDRATRPIAALPPTLGPELATSLTIAVQAHRSVTTDAGPGVRHVSDARSAGPSHPTRAGPHRTPTAQERLHHDLPGPRRRPPSTRQAKWRRMQAGK